MDLKRLTQEKLSGTEPDVLGLVEDLFAFCAQSGFLAGREKENAVIVFQMSDGSSLPVAVERAQGLFRIMCARLCKSSNDLNPSLGNIYRGFSDMPYGRGSIRIECENTLANHYFRLTYQKANEAAALDGGITPQPNAGSASPTASEPHCEAVIGMELRSNNSKVTLAIALTLALTTWPCSAHGEQILPLPLSNGLALFCFVIFLVFWRQHLLLKVLAFAILVLGIVLSWALPLLPQNTLEWELLPVGSVFAVGFGVPVALASIGCVIIHHVRRNRRHNA